MNIYAQWSLFLEQVTYTESIACTHAYTKLMYLIFFIVDLGGYWKWCGNKRPSFTLKILSAYLCSTIFFMYGLINCTHAIINVTTVTAQYWGEWYYLGIQGGWSHSSYKCSPCAITLLLGFLHTKLNLFLSQHVQKNTALILMHVFAQTLYYLIIIPVIQIFMCCECMCVHLLCMPELLSTFHSCRIWRSSTTTSGLCFPPSILRSPSPTRPSQHWTKPGAKKRYTW